MTRPIIAALALTMLLSACGAVRDSRLNPFNWFGASRSAPTTLGPTLITEDTRPLVAQVTSLAIERTSTGAIIRAEGLTPTQGWWNAELVPQTSLTPIDGVVVYHFRISGPDRQMPSAPRTSAARAADGSARQFDHPHLRALRGQRQFAPAQPQRVVRTVRPASRAGPAGRADRPRWRRDRRNWRSASAPRPTPRPRLEQHPQQIGQRRVDLQMPVVAPRGAAKILGRHRLRLDGSPPGCPRRSRPAAPRAAAAASGPAPRWLSGRVEASSSSASSFITRERGMLRLWA
jgi:hypothetical protein